MQCLRCNTKMKHYQFNQSLNIYGAVHNLQPFLAERREPHNPQSVYICENCGYVEFNMNPCENPDI